MVKVNHECKSTFKGIIQIRLDVVGTINLFFDSAKMWQSAWGNYWSTQSFDEVPLLSVYDKAFK